MSTPKLIAFHGDKKLKAVTVKEIKWHQEQDKIAQGSYETNGMYCAVGCSIHSLNKKLGKNYAHGDHSAYETELGIPIEIARIEDRIFEGLDTEEAKEFPLRFIKSVNVGADLSLVMAQWFVWLLGDPEDGVIRYAQPDGRKAIQRVIDLYSKKIAGENVTKEQWSAAATAATTGYAATAAYAATTAAGYAATAAYAYAAAAYAAAATTTAYAATYAPVHYKKMADKLIEILKSTKAEQ